jgi:hypothetical protein
MEEIKTTNHSDRDHALLSASSAHRWLACPPSAVAAEMYPNPDTEFTREGTLAHEVAEHIAGGGEPDVDQLRDWGADYDQEMVNCATAYKEYIQELTKSDDAIMLLQIDGQRVARKVKKQDGGRLLLQSYNYEYEGKVVDIKTVLVLGRCVRLEKTL